MFNHPVTKQEKTLVILLRWWAIVFALAGITFAALPEQVVSFLNLLGSNAFRWNSPPIALPSEKFWLVLAVTMMLMLVIAAIKAQHDLIKNMDYVILIIIAKLSSTLGFLLCFIFFGHAFAYLAGAVIDGSIFIITLFTYHRAVASRSIT